MRIIFKQNYFIKNALEKESYQGEFPQTVKCQKCSKGKALPLLVINDDEGLISLEREDVLHLGEGIWPHDCLAISLYLCPRCGEITALWNQG